MLPHITSRSGDMTTCPFNACINCFNVVRMTDSKLLYLQGTMALPPATPLPVKLQERSDT
jgi:hypothetical protein